MTLPYEETSGSSSSTIYESESMTTTTLFLTDTGTQTFLVPSDWNNDDNRIEVIGAGSAGTFSESGGGGAWSYKDNVTLIPEAIIDYTVGAGTTTSNNDTWFGSPDYLTSIVGAKGALGIDPGLSQTGNSIVVILYRGDGGFSGGTGKTSNGGAGGAGGPHGNGKSGAQALAGGGGGSGGGSVGLPPISLAGGSGGNNYLGTGGGAGGTGTGVPTGNGHTGINGGGGGGGSKNDNDEAGHGGIGGTGSEWDSTHGSGGGGGSPGDSSHLGGIGGLYGGGGGRLAVGGQGIVMITYTPLPFESFSSVNPDSIFEEN